MNTIAKHPLITAEFRLRSTLIDIIIDLVPPLRADLEWPQFMSCWIDPRAKDMATCRAAKRFRTATAPPQAACASPRTDQLRLGAALAPRSRNPAPLADRVHA